MTKFSSDLAINLVHCASYPLPPTGQLAPSRQANEILRLTVVFGHPNTCQLEPEIKDVISSSVIESLSESFLPYTP